ncbi:MAG: helix-turn-helix domain-containing protein [Dyella sp.]
MDNTAIQVATKLAGGQAALARAVGVTQPLVWQWCAGRRPVAPQHCIKIEESTKGQVTRYDLRPDVFGEAPKAKKARAA